MSLLARIAAWLAPAREPTPEDLRLWARGFFAAGGVLTLEAAERLTPDQLAVLVDEAERVWTERAVRLAAILRSPRGAAEALRPYDGGRAADALTARETLERLPSAEAR